MTLLLTPGLKSALNYIKFVFLSSLSWKPSVYLITYAIVEREEKCEEKMGCITEPAGIVAKSIA